MGHFKMNSSTDALLELISNQIQLAERRSEFEASGRGGPDREAFLRQIEALRIKIINQRAALGISVDGV